MKKLCRRTWYSEKLTEICINSFYIDDCEQKLGAKKIEIKIAALYD